MNGSFDYCLFEDFHPSQQFSSHVETFSQVERVLSNEDEVSCSRTQHSDQKCRIKIVARVSYQEETKARCWDLDYWRETILVSTLNLRINVNWSNLVLHVVRSVVTFVLHPNRKIHVYS